MPHIPLTHIPRILMIKEGWEAVWLSLLQPSVDFYSSFFSLFRSAFLSFLKDPQLIDKMGVIRTVSGNTCTVYLYDEKRDISVNSNNIISVEPAKSDKVSGVCCD